MKGVYKKLICIQPRKGIFLLAIVFLFSLISIGPRVASAAPYVKRVSGNDRIETAIKISQEGWDTAKNVILARADNPADALSSSSLSGSVDAPILLTYPTNLEQNIIDEIKRLKATTVYILGGPGAISNNVSTKLSSMGLTVKRLGGATRFETASLINNAAKTSLNSKAIVVNGYATPDALSAASNSANNLIPIYLSTKTTLPVNLPSTVKEVTIYGGIGVVGKEVEALLSKKGIKVTRISGQTRYDTNINAVDDNKNENVIIVRGTSTSANIEDYPDAVAGAGLSHKLNANIILTDPTSTVPVVADYFDSHRYPNVYVLGGEGAVASDVVYSYIMLPDSTIKQIFDFTPVAADVDPTKSIIYLLNNVNDTLVSYNYQSNELKSLKLSGTPEELYVRDNKIYITIVDKPHSSYWDESQQSGGIDIIDSDHFQFAKNIRINIDPFDIVVDNKGIMYISSGSGQWTYIKSYSSDTGAELSSMSIRQKSYLELNPSGTKVYATDSDLSPRDITQFTIQDGKLIYSQDSPYHGDYDLGLLTKISPDGQYLFNDSGNVFDQNLLYAGTIEMPFNDITFDLEHDRFFTATQDVILENDYSTFENYDYYLANGDIGQIYYKDNKIIILSRVTISQTTGLKKFAIETLNLPNY